MFASRLSRIVQLVTVRVLFVANRPPPNPSRLYPFWIVTPSRTPFVTAITRTIRFIRVGSRVITVGHAFGSRSPGRPPTALPAYPPRMATPDTLHSSCVPTLNVWPAR